MPFRSTPSAWAKLASPFALSSALLVSGAAHAADPYPSKLITVVVPFPAGGTTDIVARSFAQGLSKQLGQTVVVDNKSGAGGTVGASQVAHAPADGYTLLMGGPSDQVNSPYLMAKPPYDPAKDFEPVGCAFRSANVLVVPAKFPAQTVGELVKMAKAEPGKLNFASSGNGNTSHLLGELLAQSANINITHVPYRGNAPALTDTIGGQVQMMFSAPVAVLQYLKAGSLRAIATTSGSRLRELPNVPTLRESGLPIEIYSWACFLAPAKTPGAIVDKLHDALGAVLEDPSLTSSIEALGGEKFPTTHEQARRFLASERSTWSTLIRSRNIKAD